jgi:hypothetical protein
MPRMPRDLRVERIPRHGNRGEDSHRRRIGRCRTIQVLWERVKVCAKGSHFLHKPFGVQSCTCVVAGLADS